MDTHECDAHHAQSNDNDLLPLVRGPWILGAFFFGVMAIDRHFPGLHARGGVCPRHGEWGWKSTTVAVGREGGSVKQSSRCRNETCKAEDRGEKKRSNEISFSETRQ